MTVYSKVSISVSFVAFWAYLLSVIFLPDYFTYTGCSAIFFALNFSIAASAYYVVDSRKYVHFKLLLKNFDDHEKEHPQSTQRININSFR